MTAGERAEVRRFLKEQSDAKAKEFTPGPLVSDNKWANWEPKFKNYLLTMVDMDGTPLSYIIRENDTPGVASKFSNFNEE